MGKVSDIRGWDSESGRSVAHVTWGSGSMNVYRMGHKGKVDLKYTHATSGGSYYRDHLPVLGELEFQSVIAVDQDKIAIAIILIYLETPSPFMSRLKKTAA